jgi:hypothetical protein
MDQPAGESRYVRLRLPDESGIGIWLLKAEAEEELRHIGNQTSGQPCLMIYSDDQYEAHAELSARQAQVVREPKEEAGAMFAHFEDLYGNENSAGSTAEVNQLTPLKREVSERPEYPGARQQRSFQIS